MYQHNWKAVSVIAFLLCNWTEFPLFRLQRLSPQHLHFRSYLTRTPVLSLLFGFHACLARWRNAAFWLFCAKTMLFPSYHHSNGIFKPSFPSPSRDRNLLPLQVKIKKLLTTFN